MGMRPDFRYEYYQPVYDPYGPIKYDHPDWTRLIAVLPELILRIDTIETHLASGSKQPFIRAADRPGSEGVAQMQRALETVTKRLEAIEQQVGQRSK
jgi:hypothetical protein